MKIQQEWEGYVTDVDDTEFSARLTDLTSGMNCANEEAHIPFDEISEDDVAKMQVGSIFRWTIGYECTAGSKKWMSQIVFHDLPVFTMNNRRDAEKWANSILRAFER